VPAVEPKNRPDSRLRASRQTQTWDWQSHGRDTGEAINLRTAESV